MLSSTPSKKIMFFSVNDVYEITHFGRMYEFIKRTVALQKPDHYFVTMAGDFLSPYLLSCIDKGKTMVQLMNEIGFTTACLGNHEFDLSVKNLVERIKEMKFTLINSNITPSFGCVSEQVVEIPFAPGVEPLRIGFAGFCTESTKRLCNNMPMDVKIDQIAVVAPELFSKLRQEEKCDFIVAITHQDVMFDVEMSEFEDVNLVLGGHDHVKIIQKRKNDQHKGDVWMIKAGMDMTMVAVTTVNVHLKDHLVIDIPEVPHDLAEYPYKLHTEIGHPDTPPMAKALLSGNATPRMSPHPSRARSAPKPRFDFQTSVQTVQITDVSLPTDLHIEMMIANAGQIIEHVEQQYLVRIPLENKGVRHQRTTFATYVLDKVKKSTHFDAVIAPGGIFKGKADYPEGFRIADLHNEFKWDEFFSIEITGAVLEQVLQYSRQKGGKAFLQFDSGIILNPVSGSEGSLPVSTVTPPGGSPPTGSSQVWKLECVNDEPMDPEHTYTVLFTRSMKIDKDTSLFSPPLHEWVLKCKEMNKLNPKKDRPQHHKKAKYHGKDPHHHHHERPNIVEAIISAIITHSWRDMFGAITFAELDANKDGVITRETVLKILRDESLVNAVFQVADKNRDGYIDRGEWSPHTANKHHEEL